MKKPLPPYRFKIGVIVYANTASGIKSAVVLKRHKVLPPDRSNDFLYTYAIEFDSIIWHRVNENQLMTKEEAVAARLRE